MNIAILYICTGKYTVFWKDFYSSCEKYFIPNAEKKYFVFTDSEKIDFEEKNKNIIKIKQENLGWPHNTLLRYEVFLNNEIRWNKSDYAYFFNANLIFKNLITAKEFLPENNEVITACVHPGFFNKKNIQFTYENRSKSTAFLNHNHGKYYFAGGINGGITKEFIKIIKTINENIKIDLKNGIIAIWHDESHWNKYVNNNLHKTKIIYPEYLYPEGWKIPFNKKIEIRNKKNYGGHIFLRNEKTNMVAKIKNIIEKIISNIVIVISKYAKK